MEKALSGDLIQITKAFDEPYSIGDIMEVDMRQSDMGACDDDVLMTTEGYIIKDGDYKIHKKRSRSKPVNMAVAKQLVFDCAVELLHGSEGLTNEQIGKRLLNIVEYLDGKK